MKISQVVLGTKLLGSLKGAVHVIIALRFWAPTQNLIFGE